MKLPRCSNVRKIVFPSRTNKVKIMLRFLFCLVFIAPIFFVPSLLGNQDAVASIEIEEDTYDAFTDAKLTALDACEAETIPVYFSDIFVETHSAEFLHSAVDAASDCGNATARIVGLKFDTMNDVELELSEQQVEEVAEFLNAYEVNLNIEQAAREIELDTRAVNGRAVIVEFEFDQAVETASAAHFK